MNLYDFDETIYDGDSTRDFVLYCYKNHPRTLAYLPRQLAAVTSTWLGRSTRPHLRNGISACLLPCRTSTAPSLISGTATPTASCAIIHARRVRMTWSFPRRRNYRASLCERLGLTHVIASDVDKFTGHFNGVNCYGAEKCAVLRRLATISAKSSRFIPTRSRIRRSPSWQGSFIVHKDGSLGPWEAPKQKGMQGFFTLFNKREALLTVAVALRICSPPVTLRRSSCVRKNGQPT